MAEHETYLRPEPATEAELEQCKNIAARMAEAMPPDISSAMAIATLGILIQVMFKTLIKRQYRVGACEDFFFHCRRQIVDETRREQH